MVRSFSRSVYVRVVSIEGEIRAAVLQRESAAVGDDGGAEAAVVAVDEGAGVSFAVRRSKVDCIAGLEGGTAVVDVVWECLVRVE